MHFRNSLTEITSRINTVFSQESLYLLALDAGFIRRSTNRIDPMAFFILMVAHLTANSLCSLAGMTDFLATMKGCLKISPQALAQRLNSVYAVRFLKRSYAKLLAARIQSTADSLNQTGLLKGFKRVFLEDSTSCELHERVANSYKGCGGSAHKAGYKIHLLWEAIAGGIHTLTVTGSCVTDQSMANHIEGVVEEGDLVIRDLGYFSLPIFKTIHNLKGFFLSRLKRQVNVYTLEGKKIDDLPKHIDKHFPGQPVAEIDVLLGRKEKLKVRLVAYRVTNNVVNQRMRKQKDVARKQGTSVTKGAKNWNKFTFMITNVSREVWKPEVLVTVYKLRWEIELVFKGWKSLASIDLIKGESTNRVTCFILSRLIAIYIMTMFFSCCKEYIDGKYSREISLHKFISWFLRKERLAMVPHALEFERELMFVINRSPFDLCKQKRSRKTTLEHLRHSSTYSELYSEDPEKEALMHIA